MARPLRLELAGGLYHVTSRGNARSEIYLDDEDRLNWLALFNDVCSRFNWVCHAYCLMSNHYHVVAETVEGNLAKGMRQLNGVYTQTFNRRHQRVGHVFQGRYKAILVEKDSYLLELSRYVVLNPVRAHRVKDVADWPWSSYCATIIQAQPLPSLQVDGLLSQFGSNREQAIARYQNFVRAGMALPPVWEHLKNQIFLGDIVVGDLILAELLQGFRSEKDYQTAKSLLEELEPAQLCNSELAVKSAQHYRILRKKGITVRKTIDGIIATFCIENEMPLLFSDRDFVPYVENLRLIDAANLF